MESKITGGLPELRQQIRDIDDQIFALAARRFAVAKAIGDVKMREQLPIKDYKVEKEVVARSLEKASQLGLYAEFAEALSRLLIRYSVMAQDEFHAASRRRRPSDKRRILIVGGRGRMGLWLSEFFESFGHHVAHADVASAAAGGSRRVESPPYPLVDDLRAAAKAQDVIVLATPISATAALIDLLADSGTEALVFDICSLKSPLLPAIRRAAARGLRIASVHPMFGPRVELLSGRNIVVCRVADAAASAEARALFADTTAHLVEIPLESHDELMSYVLGLSHLTNLAFAGVLAESGLPFAALRAVASTTFNAQLAVTQPVVDENRELYYEIQAENSFSAPLIAKLRSALEAYATAIAAADRPAFVALMAKSQAYLHPRGEDAAASTGLPETGPSG